MSGVASGVITTATSGTVAGIVLPASLLQTEFFAILSAFVAVNTLIYVTLAIAKILPRVYLSDLFPQRGRRREPRGINPSAPAEDNPG